MNKNHKSKCSYTYNTSHRILLRSHITLVAQHLSHARLPSKNLFSMSITLLFHQCNPLSRIQFRCRLAILGADFIQNIFYESTNFFKLISLVCVEIYPEFILTFFLIFIIYLFFHIFICFSYFLYIFFLNFIHQISFPNSPSLYKITAKPHIINFYAQKSYHTLPLIPFVTPSPCLTSSTHSHTRTHIDICLSHRVLMALEQASWLLSTLLCLI